MILRYGEILFQQIVVYCTMYSMQALIGLKIHLLSNKGRDPSRDLLGGDL